jgi:fatty acid desaturase
MGRVRQGAPHSRLQASAGALEARNGGEKPLLCGPHGGISGRTRGRRSARREAATYEPALRRTIAVERWVSIACHLAVLGGLAWFAGRGAAVRAYIIPVFFVFPVAFPLNRLGQHCSIEPGDPAGWTTLMRGHWFWDFAFLNSNYHLEHHSFPSVPFYRLSELQRLLTPFFERKGLVWRACGDLLRGWFIDNRAPHTNWEERTGSSQ